MKKKKSFNDSHKWRRTGSRSRNLLMKIPIGFLQKKSKRRLMGRIKKKKKKNVEMLALTKIQTGNRA